MPYKDIHTNCVWNWISLGNDVINVEISQSFCKVGCTRTESPPKTCQSQQIEDDTTTSKWHFMEQKHANTISKKMTKIDSAISVCVCVGGISGWDAQKHYGLLTGWERCEPVGSTRIWMYHQLWSLACDADKAVCPNLQIQDREENNLSHRRQYCKDPSQFDDNKSHYKFWLASPTKFNAQSRFDTFWHLFVWADENWIMQTFSWKCCHNQKNG